jgi:hypothetical protein
MNRTSLLEQATAPSSTEESTGQLWLIRAGKEQKTFVAKALELIERLDAWREHRVAPEAVAEVEADAQRLGFHEVCAAMRAVGQMILTHDARAFQHPGSLATLPPLPAGTARPLSALLLRVYLTGTDVGGAMEREQVQELIAIHMQLVLPSAGYSKRAQN